MGTPTDRLSRSSATDALPTDPALYRAVFTHAIEGLALSAGGLIIDINEAALQIFGYQRDELIGTSLAELVAPEARPVVADAIGAHEPALYELTFLRRDGSRFEAEAQARMIDLGDRQVRLTVMRDISERRRRAASLLDHQTKLDMAMRVARLGHWDLDLSTMLFTFDDSFLDLLGTSAAREGGHTMHADDYAKRFLPPEESAIVAREIQTSLNLSDPVCDRQLEHRLIRADGSTGIMRVNISVVRDAQGRSLRAHGVNQDVTSLRAAERERQRLQEQLQHHQKLEALGTLAGGIAHDFNNILTGILGNLQLATEDLAPSHPSHPSVADATRAARRARELVSRILAFGRRTPNQRHVIPLSAVVEEVAQLLRASAPPDVCVTTGLEPACPMVECDPAEIHQVLLNLGTNALQALPPRGGRIHLGLHFAEPTGDLRQRHPDLQPGHVVHLGVEDNGSGIDPALLQRIFEPFFTTKPTGEGTGLGLTTVHRIMQNHGGCVTVESIPGERTRFELHFLAAAVASPAIDQPIEPPPLAPVNAPFGQGRRLLLVDDDAIARTTSQRALERLGFQTLALADPLDALAQFRQCPHDFSAVVTDLAMPRMDGIELASHLCELNPAVAVVLLSGYIHDPSADRAPAAGIRRILGKPYDLADLAVALQAVLAPAGAKAGQ